MHVCMYVSLASTWAVGLILFKSKTKFQFSQNVSNDSNSILLIYGAHRPKRNCT
jgi:hypothetical protein